MACDFLEKKLNYLYFISGDEKLKLNNDLFDSLINLVWIELNDEMDEIMFEL